MPPTLLQDDAYNPAVSLVRVISKSPGYHTLVPDGTPVHHIRCSAEYATLCLMAGDPEHIARAHAVLRKLVELQHREDDLYKGIWSWFYEEPVPQMERPDRNWADFIGARLAQVLMVHGHLLPPDLTADIRAAIALAAEHIVARDSHVGYTNIAIMGSVVTLAAGELLTRPELADYGRDKLLRIEAHTQTTDGFGEYNSPTYSIVAIRELDRLELLVKDTTARDIGRRLWHRAWQDMAHHYHPATQQWAGPHSRAYSERLMPDQCAFLSTATGVDIRPAGVDSVALDPYELIPIRPCPPELIERFTRLPSPEITVTRTYKRSANAPDIVATTWLTEAACLGSATYERAWAQRRFCQGYWVMPTGPAAVLRVRMMMNGRDFAAGHVKQQQLGPRVLATFGTMLDTGPFHPPNNKPEDNIFHDLQDLRLRVELHAHAAAARPVAHGVELVAGEHKVQILPAPGSTFDGREVTWQTTPLEDGVAYEGVLYHGTPRPFDLKAVETRLAVALALLPKSAPPEPPPTLNKTAATWQNTHTVDLTPTAIVYPY